ncbi:MAG: cytochrome c [Opitutaceae bacterium]|jgi:mono/diheme cytochrome c family protein
MRTIYLILVFAVAFTLSIFGFRGRISTETPRDVFPEWGFPGMKYQPRYLNQGESAFFSDARAARPAPPGAVASSYGPAGGPLRADDRLFRGKAPNGDWARGFPESLKVDEIFMRRGKERYAIYCQPCHGALGDGMGITKAYAMGATPSYHIDRLRQIAEGEIFNTVTQGLGNMQSYADKMTPADRWAVIAYLRALQRAQTGRVEDVPAASRKELGIR